MAATHKSEVSPYPHSTIYFAAKVAHSLLGVRFVCQSDLEEALCHMLGCNSSELLGPLAQAGLVLAGLADPRTAMEEEDVALEGVSRAAALVASMLS